METSAAATGSFEEILLRELRFGGIDKENLKELVGIVANLQKGGLKNVKVFPKGIPPVVDGLRIAGSLGSDAVARFIGEVLARSPRLSGVELFPLGIPWPEVWKVAVDIGATVQPPVGTGAGARF